MKKKKVFMFLVFICCFIYGLGAREYRLESSNLADGTILVTFELLAEPDIQDVVKDGQVFSKIMNLHDFIRSTEKGYPQYLSKQVPLMIDSAKEYSLKIIRAEYNSYDLSNPYIVGRGIITRNTDPDSVPYEIAAGSLRNSDFPGTIVEQEEYFYIRNVRGYNFRFNITGFNTRLNTMKVYTNLTFELRPTGVRADTIVTHGGNKVNPQLFNILSGLFSNYSGSTRAAWPYELGETGDILVIYTSRDSQAIQPYIQHKKNIGFNVIPREVPRGTNARPVIQEEYNKNNNLLYVQLVGDWDDIRSDLDSSGAPTDPFLGAVSGNDNYIDLIIGRFSAENAGQVTIQVDKTINYELNKNKPWALKGLGIASDEGAGSGDDSESDFQHMDIIKENKLIPGGFGSVAEVYQAGSPSQVAGHINDGVGVINYTGHGSNTSWGTTGFSNWDIDGLNNGDKLPFIFSVACVNGTFHQNTCFAETWLRKSGGGAVGTLMSTINQPWQPPMRGQDYMNDLLTGGYNYGANPGSGTSTDHGKKTYGSIIFNAFTLWYAESSTASDLMTIKTWVLFGDASLNVTGTVDDGSQNNWQGDYKIISVYNGKSLDIAGQSTENGANIHQWDYLSLPSQHWTITNVGDNKVTIQSKQSGRTLDAQEGGWWNGANVCQWDHTGINQEWYLTKLDNGNYLISSAASGLALDVAEYSTENGGNIGLWEFGGGANQQWQIEHVESGGKSVALMAKTNSRFVCAENFGWDPVKARSETINQWETFSLIYNTDGTVSFQSHANQRYLQTPDWGWGEMVAIGENIGDWEKFYLLYNYDGSVSLQAVSNGKFVQAADWGWGPLGAWGHSVGDWEKFTLIYLE